MIRRLVAAVCLAAAALFAMPAVAADPPLSSVPFTAGSTTYQEGVYSDGTHFFVDHMAGGWTGSAWKPFFVDPATGYLGTLLSPGAATSARQDALLAALGSPLQAGGAVTVVGGATSAKQDALLTALGSPLQAGGAVTVLGGSTAAKQDALLAALGAPLQAGGSVVVASTPLPPGASTLALQSSIGATAHTDAQAVTAALGSPLQAGGAVSVPGVATAANQANAQASFSALVATQGSPTDAKSTATDGTAASMTALLKGEIDRLQAVVTAVTQAGGLPVAVGSSALPAGAATASGVAQLHGDLTPAGGLPVAVASSALPAGAATAARQDALLSALGAPAQAGGKVDTVITSTAANRGANFTSATALTLMAANPSRRGLQIQVQGSSACYMSGLAAATADYNSLLIPAGGLYESQPQHTGTGAISVICPSATTSVPVPVYAREF